MVMFRIEKLTALAAIAALLAALAGCVTAENALSPNDVASMRLTGVNVSFAPDSLVSTPESEAAYAAAKGIPEGQMLTALRTPEYREFVRGMVGPKGKAGVEQAMAGRLNGSRPVRLEIVVSRYTVPSVMWRAVVGGDPEMIAAVTLVDARSGAVVLANPKVEGFAPGGHGIAGVLVQSAFDSATKQGMEDRMIAYFAREYGNWLTHGA